MPSPSVPAAPTELTSFTAIVTNNPAALLPGAQLDAEFNQVYTTLSKLIAVFSVSINADGTLNPAAVEAAYAAVSGANTGNEVNVADAPSALSALLAQAWAEYLPGELPADTLANTGITGQHFSSRYYASVAASTVSQINAIIYEYQQSVAAQIASGAVTIQTDAISVGLTPMSGDGTTTAFALTQAGTTLNAAPSSPYELYITLGGVLQMPGVDFTVVSSVLTFTTAPEAGDVIEGVWLAPGNASGLGVSLPATLDGGMF